MSDDQRYYDILLKNVDVLVVKNEIENLADLRDHVKNAPIAQRAALDFAIEVFAIILNHHDADKAL